MVAFWIFLFVLLAAVFLGLVLSAPFFGSSRTRNLNKGLTTARLEKLYRKHHYGDKRVFLDLSSVTPHEWIFLPDDIVSELDRCPNRVVSVPEDLITEWNSSLDEYDEFNRRLGETCENNNRGIELEKLGRIDEAIKVYEKNISIGYLATHAYERLRIIYKRRKNPANELRVLRAGVALFEPANDERFRKALSEYPQLEEEIGNARCNPKKGTLRDENGDLVVAFISEEAKYRYRIQALLKKYPDLEC